MYLKKILVVTGILLAVGLWASGQQKAKPVSKTSQTSAKKLTPPQKFVLDTVNMAVALPQPDTQDRLRVLAAAANVVSPIDQKIAKTLWREGVCIESELIQFGRTPAGSLMAKRPTGRTSPPSFCG